jgi:hypothetical protein
VIAPAADFDNLFKLGLFLFRRSSGLGVFPHSARRIAALLATNLRLETLDFLTEALSHELAGLENAEVGYV